MIRLMTILSVLGLMTISGCSEEAPAPAPAQVSESSAPNTQQVSLLHYKVSGMTCGGCEAAITNKVKQIAGVSECKASHENGEVVVTTNDPSISPHVIEAITSLNFAAEEAVEPAS